MSETIYNAAEGLEGFKPEESRPMRTRKNFLEDGKSFVFLDTGESELWSDEKEYAILETKEGIKCNAPYVASCMLENDAIIENKGEEGLECMHTPRTAADANIEGFSYVHKHLTPEGHFPKFTAVKSLPVAMKREDLLNASKETKALYEERFGTPLEKMKQAWLPNLRRSKYGDRGLYSIKSTIVSMS